MEALNAIPAPCCDDNPVLKCCCQGHGRICNLTRSAQGLAKWLIVYHGYSVSVFLVPNYYLAKTWRNKDLISGGSGSRGTRLMKLVIKGCGGMGLEVKIANPPAVPPCCVPQG